MLIAIAKLDFVKGASTSNFGARWRKEIALDEYLATVPKSKAAAMSELPNHGKSLQEPHHSCLLIMSILAQLDLLDKPWLYLPMIETASA